MSEPRKHHYIPRFFLASWATGDKLIYYKRIQDRVVAEAIHPRSTAFEPDLYTLAHLPPEMRQNFEKYVTSDVDGRAAIALQQLQTGGVEQLSDSDRLAWAQFLVSLPVRNPDAVTDIKQNSSKAALERALDQAAREHPEWAGEPDFAREFSDAVESDPATAFLSANYGLLVIGNLMLNPEFQEPLLRMNWWTMDFSGADFSLLVSDRPYMVFRYLSHPRSLIYVPTSPKLAFFASPDPGKRAQLEAKGLNYLAKRLNGFQVDLAIRHIYAADRSHDRFVRNRWRLNGQES